MRSQTIAENNKSLSELAVQNPMLANDIVQTWGTDSNIRAEFCDNLTNYTAYMKAKADGRFRVMGAGQGLIRGKP